jgi:carboxyl-terminal processing protease
MKKDYLFLALLSLLAVVPAKAQTYQQKMATFLNLLDNYYVSPVDMDSMVEVGIVNILKQLDPHSVYMNSDEFKKNNEPLEGNFEGVGIQFQIYEDTIVVVHVIHGGPSQQVGVQDGDKIVYVDTAKVAGIGINNDGVFKKLRGRKGTHVTIQVKRFGEPELLEFEIIRDKIPIYAIEAKYMAAPEIGYIKLGRFSVSASNEVKAAVDSLKNQGAKKLILDLTGNGGGYLNQAHELADIFLEESKLVVYSEGRSQPRIDLNASGGGNFETGDIVIMVDQTTASASEIVSGALQDWDRGLIVGRRTYGKGLVQKGYTLPDLSVVRLTMAHYYTPSGRNIQRPYSKGDDKYYDDLEDRYESGELFDSSKIRIIDSTQYLTHNKRVVYGGGGIVPDIYVPLDTLWTSRFYGKLIRSGSFNQFALSYVEKNRQALTDKYPDPKLYIAQFRSDSVLMQEFFDFAKSKKAEPDSAENFSQSIQMIQTQLKGLIGQNLFTYDVYYEITNEINPIYLRALLAFSDGSFEKYGIRQVKPKDVKQNKQKKPAKQAYRKEENVLQPVPARSE